MSAPVRAALDTTGDVHRPELAHPWLQVDLANPDNDGISTRSYEITGDQILFKALEFPRGFNAWNPGLPVLDTDLLAGRPVGWSGTLSSFDQGKTATSAATASISAAPSAELPGCVRTTARFTFADASTSTIGTTGAPVSVPAGPVTASVPATATSGPMRHRRPIRYPPTSRPGR